MAKFNVREFFQQFPASMPAEQMQLWRDWFTTHGIDPDEVSFEHWVERRLHDENKIVYLVPAVRDGEPITQEREKILGQPPAPFPVP